MKKQALSMISELTVEDIMYAGSPEREEYRGFAALHDLFDANTLLPDLTEDNLHEQINEANKITDVVSQLIIAIYDVFTAKVDK